MKPFNYVILILILMFSQNVFSANVYKCKDAEGNILFSNFRCKGDDASKGLIDDTVTRKGKPLKNKESDAEKQLQKIQQTRDKEYRSIQQHKKDKRTATLNKLKKQKERQKLANSKAKAKADCKYNKAKANYWREKSRDIDISKRAQYLYESKQHKYEAKASGC